MTEGAITRKLRRRLDPLSPECHPRMREARAVVHRHVNLYEGGVLDMSVSVGQFTLWIELKVEPRQLTKLQAYTVKHLRDGAFVITFDKGGKLAVIDKLSMIGVLSFEQVVDEIVATVLDNGVVRGGLPRSIQEALNSGDGTYRP